MIKAKRRRATRIDMNVRAPALRRLCHATCAVLANFAWISYATALESAQLRRFESRDAVEMSEFTEAPLFSPDGKHFVTVTQRGVLPQGFTEATVWLFETDGVRRSLRDGASVAPVSLARLTATVNGGTGTLSQKGVLMRLEWEPDSRGVLFMGRDGRDNRQLFRARLASSKAVPLTPTSHDVVDYAVASDRIVYFAGPDASAEKQWWSVDPSAADIVAGTGEPLMNLLYPNYEKSHRAMPTVFEVWQISGESASPVNDATTGKPLRVLGSYNVSAMSLSPDGAQMIAVTHADRIPALWEQYEITTDPNTRGFRADSLSTVGAETARQRDYSRALQYMHIDIRTGVYGALIDAPIADFQRAGTDALLARWSPDGEHVAVSGTYLPLNGTSGSDPARRRHCSVAVVAKRTSEIACLTELNHPSPSVRNIRWLSTRRLIAELSASGSLAVEHRNGRWQRASTTRVPQRAATPLSASIQQALDLPPGVFVKEAGSGRGRRIFDPNPQLANIDRGGVIEYSWKDRHGRLIRAGLAKPTKLVPGRRYPLVIQTHGFRRDRFFRVGYSDTSNAGRALAGRDILVLQVAEPLEPYEGTAQEGEENGTQVYLSAIDKLAADGLVDSKKVGISGYSRMGFFVAKAITDAPDRFAAAVVANADPGSLIGYFSYIDYIMPTYARNAAELFAGALPYGDGLQRWVEKAPGFRTERIRAPVLISATDPQHLISLWGLYAPLRDQRKPVELQYIRSGEHSISKPLQRLAHQEMIVDWFDFWLNEHEDSNESKAAQYERWRALATSSPSQ